MEFKKYLLEKCRAAVNSIEESAYAISFFIHVNEATEYEGIANFPEFFITYNTEEGCGYAPAVSEERWNMAFWAMEEIPVVDAYNGNDGAEKLLSWYREIGITDIGTDGEDEDRGPVGYFEFASLLSEVARELQADGTVSSKFGNIPIIFHEYDIPRFFSELVSYANPNGEAHDFLETMKQCLI